MATYRHAICAALLLLSACSSHKLTTEVMQHQTLTTTDLSKLTQATMDLDVDVLIIDPVPADTHRIVGRIAKRIQTSQTQHAVQESTDTTKRRQTQEKQPNSVSHDDSMKQELKEFVVFCCILIFLVVFLRRKCIV